MASSRGRSRGSAGKGRQTNGAGDSGVIAPMPTGTAGTTGKYLVLMKPGAVDAGVRALTDTVGVRVMSAADFEGSAVSSDALAESGAVVFNTLGVAVVSTPPDQFSALGAALTDDSPFLAIEEERIVYAIDENGRSLLTAPALPVTPVVISEGAPVGGGLAEYLRGYQDAVNHLVEHLLGESDTEEMEDIITAAPIETELTWGLQATNVPASRYTGKGVRVAVLDTGFDLGHPDFVGRRITAQSFIQNQAVQDGHGHGTHCIGTACGPKRPGQLPRYGIAYDAEIYVGKVLSNQGSGSDGGILAGIEWAINNGCAVISMSLGAPTIVGQTYSRIFEAVARRALAAGSLIVAAAGNESQRPGRINPVGHPANCPSIIAVGALDAQLAIAFFSCGGLNLQGGQVDIAGPGVNIRSSWPRPTLYRSISGTSMATPHVAGIAALHAEANPDMRGGTLGWLLLQSARRIDLPARDIGAGLVQAPA